jgi:hypothetical protein
MHTLLLLLLTILPVFAENKTETEELEKALDTLKNTVQLSALVYVLMSIEVDFMEICLWLTLTNFGIGEYCVLKVMMRHL